VYRRSVLALALLHQLSAAWVQSTACHKIVKEMNGMQERKKLDSLRVAILVNDDFEQVEMVEPRKALDAAGAQTTLIAPKAGQVTGMNHDKQADTFPVEMTLDQAEPAQFDALLLPGGALNADSLRMNPKAQEFARRMNDAGRPMAIICHAPWLLVSTGLVSGRTLTSWPTIQDDIRNAGGTWQDRAMVRDRNWVTSRGPQDIPAFNEAMIAAFAEQHVGAR
jgi:protease I